MGIDPHDNLYVLDHWRKQTSPHEWVEAWCDLVKRWRPTFWAFEKGALVNAVEPYLKQRARERKTWTAMEEFPTRHSKHVRAQSIAGRMGMVGLRIPRNAAWSAELRAELLSFPAGKHDDQVDALALVGQLLENVLPGREPRVEAQELKTDDGYRDATEEDFGGVASIPSILTL